MPKATRLADIYLRYLSLKEAITGLPTLAALDPLEERILGLIARKAHEASRLSVRDVMSVEGLGSPATIHSRLKSLRKKGWIRLADTEDARRKQVVLSPAALKHFEKLSKCMLEAADL